MEQVNSFEKIINDENAPLLWKMISQAKDSAIKLCWEKGMYSSIARDLYIDGYVAGRVGRQLGFPEEKEVELLGRLEDKLESYRQKKLLQLPIWNSCYQTDGVVIFPSDDTWEQDLDWDILNDIIKKENKMGIYSDLIVQDEFSFDPQTSDLQAYVKQKQRDTMMQITRKMILEGRLTCKNEINRCTGMSEEEAEILLKECEIRKKIDDELNDIYICKAIYGLSIFIKNHASADEKIRMWISYIAGISLGKTLEWEEETEKEMIIEACRHRIKETTIAKRLRIPEKTVDAYYIDPSIYENTEIMMYEKRAIPNIHMSDECRKAIYKKYVKSFTGESHCCASSK